jgi:anti-sigma regulatory factor (Ser/Thr protein kinase)/serine/threonine protein phosphatase PrpC
MEIKRDNIISLPIDNDSDIGTCRRKGVALAAQMGFDKVKQGEIAILISELGTNVLKHGGGRGKIVISQIEDEQFRKAIEVWCCDTGDGIPDLQNALKDGFSKKKTLGIGLGTIARFSDEVEINPSSQSLFRQDYFSEKNGYTHCLRSVKWMPSKNSIYFNNNLLTGAVSRCYPGEHLNGDAYLVNNIDNNTTIAAVIDGLGHGAEANLASEKAKEQIILKSDLPLDSLMKHVHNSIRGTRGAVVAIARINTLANKLQFSGIGNIESFIITDEGKKTLLSFGGIMGHNMRTPRVFDFDFKPGNTLCMYSDGITTRWRQEDIDWTNSPQKNSEHIINNHSRTNDDATILIIRHTA